MVLERRHSLVKIDEVHLEWKKHGDDLGVGSTRILDECDFGLGVIRAM